MTLSTQSNTRLHGRWLQIACRIALVAYIGLAALFVIGLWLFPDYTPTLVATRRPAPNWTAEQFISSLNELGLSPNWLGGYQIVLDLIACLCFGGMGLLLFWRKSDDWFGLYVSAEFVLFGAMSGTMPYAVAQIGMGWDEIVRGLQGIAWLSLFPLFYFFPDGRCVPHWARWFFPFYAGYVVFLVFTNFGADNPASALGVFAFLGLGIVSQIYRYWRVSDYLGRLQTRWVMFAISLWFIRSVVMFSPLGGALLATPNSTALIVWLASGISSYILLSLIPIAISVAILRYRLWDIDIIIRRTLQYSLLSGLLALTYFGGVVVLQSIFTAVTGQSQSPLVTVLSTLAIAALFFPLRKRVQDFIDKRFFRQKYDAAKTLADFAATARDETDLDKLTARLLEVVDETMQPESVALWLKDSKSESQRGEETKYSKQFFEDGAAT